MTVRNAGAHRSTAARLGIRNHAIAPGNVANLLVHRPSSVRELLAEHEAPAYGVRRGQIIATNPAGRRV